MHRTRLTLPTCICSPNLHFLCVFLHFFHTSNLHFLSKPSLPLCLPTLLTHVLLTASHHLQTTPWHHRSNASGTLQVLPLKRLRHHNLHNTNAMRISRGRALSMPRPCPAPASHFQPPPALQTFIFSAYSCTSSNLHFLSTTSLSLCLPTLLTHFLLTASHHLQPTPPWHHSSNASSTLQVLPVIRLRNHNLHKTNAMRISRGRAPKPRRPCPDHAPHPPHTSNLHLLSKPSFSLRFPTLLSFQPTFPLHNFTSFVPSYTSYTCPTNSEPPSANNTTLTPPIQCV